MGDVCAVKVFADLVRTVHIQIKTRELELMRKLKHRNVVCLLAIEQEVRHNNNNNNNSNSNNKNNKFNVRVPTHP